ncbi:hypothetical protein [Pleionea sp. CnH1-48]|uniref:hypothetical protein n=1 Tax=Pleionea sp. CnH1-48 TaxID=2954494 RepID=UPI0020982F0C|nr:hypothetical protein [Pleionea sp. CnH1-48]MCO7224106.1 hypothetical protein [Pleionea sp. CnH1-48]
MRKLLVTVTLATSALLYSSESSAETVYSVYCNGEHYYSSSSVRGVRWAVSVCESMGGTAAVFRYAD